VKSFGLVFHWMLPSLLLLAAIGGTQSYAQTKQSWCLSPINGNQKKGWADGANWKWEKGNPASDKGAKWWLCRKDGGSLGQFTDYSGMTRGLYVNFHRVWLGVMQDGKKALNRYREYKVLTSNGMNKPGAGSVSAVMFQPPEQDKYRIHLSGICIAQNKSAGFTRVTICVFSQEESTVDKLAQFDLSLPGGFDSQNKAEKFRFDRIVPLETDQWLAVCVQGVNPGVGSIGMAGINFDPKIGGHFEITAEN